MILVISCFGFEGWIWVLIASVPDLCILFTFFQSDFVTEAGHAKSAFQTPIFAIKQPKIMLLR